MVRCKNCTLVACYLPQYHIPSKQVFIELILHFGRWGCEGPLTKQSIIFKKDHVGREYACLAHNELDKTHQVLAPKEPEKLHVMYSMPGDAHCPVQSLKL